MSFLKYIAFLILCASALGETQTATFTFANDDYFDAANSTAVWNLALETLHVPFIIDRTSTDATQNEDDSVPIGTGQDGDFNSSTYAQFDVNQLSIPNLITLDTTRTYQFRNFTLDSGYTLTGIGSEPLVIYVQGSVDIAGTIDLRGGNGASGSTDVTNQAAGGSACCGGAKGGAGGTSTLSASNGVSADSADKGKGLAGQPSGTDNQASGGGGGGGGAFQVNNSFPAQPGASNANSEGQMFEDDYLASLSGGSGGAGGGSYTRAVGTDGSGGGGGGGGGALKMTAGGAFTVESTGSILVTGGKGGSAAGTLSGTGGGGAGGEIALYVGGNFSVAGTIDATAGKGGDGGGTNKGDGGAGITRIVYDVDNNNWNPFVGGQINPGELLADFGETFYSQKSYSIQSKSFDTRNSAPTYVSLTPVDSQPTNTSIQYFVAGSSDNFQSDDTGWVASTNLSAINGKRYFKFKVVLQTESRTISPTVSQIAVSYDLHAQQDFNFDTAGGCAAVHFDSDPWMGKCASLLFLVYLFLLPYLTSRLCLRPSESKASRRNRDL